MMRGGATNGRRIADWVYDGIRDSILSGELPPGHRLRQTDVANEFEVSHTPVREALARLASEGLVTLRPHRGAEVNSLSAEEIHEIYQVRQLLEPYAAGLTAKNASDEELARIKRAAQAASKSAKPLDLFTANRAFHLALYQPCGNGRLVQILDSLWDSVTAVRMFEVYVSRPEDLKKMHAEHRAIAQAVGERDGKRAAELLRSHLDFAHDELVSLLTGER
ncbi:MAG: GntR family transcriptional regulator [Solirubrobacteraceae bacterium]|nr:GntR family transcriptional regulator [Solirubrobacteraceae bacterium]